MRILLVDLELEWRGGQSQALLLLRGLRDRGHAAELLSVAGSALAERAAAAGVPVHAARAALRRPHAAWLLRGLLRRKRFDLVHANDAHALTAAWAARTHKMAPLVASRRVLFPVGRGAISLARYRAAACIVAVSQAVRAALCAAGLDERRIEVVPDGVELGPPITADERARARALWGIATNVPVVSYVAALTAEKGHDLLLDAFAEVKRSVPASRLVLAGSGPLLGVLQEKARLAGILPHVCFAGFVREPREIYAASDLFLFPSLREGLGSSLLGAMACGLPVVACRGGATAEVLDDGCNGLVVAPEARLLAAAAALLLCDAAAARRLGEAARRTVEQRFSAAGMVAATERIYGRLIGPR